MNYDQEVKDYLKKIKDQKVKDEVIALYLYLNREYATELAMAQRDYDLGLANDIPKKKIQNKAYIKENKLREYLGLAPLPPIDLSIL